MCDGLMLQKDPKSTAAALIAHANKAFGGSQSEGAYTAKDAADILELACNQSILASPALYDPRVDAAGAVAAIGRLAKMMSVLPTQTRRDEEQEQFQQFSTPPHLAYLVAWAANLSPDDVVLEPSAGVGGIAVFALNAGATVYVNELSERRSRLLSILPFKDRFCENAEQLNNVLPAHVKPSVVVQNPPFSRSPRLGDKKDAAIGMRHITQALKRLVPGGRMVAIMGDRQVRNGPPSMQATMGDWSEISKEYTILASIGIPGREYAKMGTAFDCRVWVVDKISPTGQAPLFADAESVVQAVELLAPARELRGKIDALPVQEPAHRPAYHQPKLPVADQTIPGERETVSGPIPAPPATDDGIPGADASVSAPADTLRITASPTVNAAPLSDAIFEAYRPQRLHVDGAHEHPTPLVQSAAMASVLPPAPTYAPALPHELIETGALSEAQIEAVVYAGQAHRQYLPEVEVEDPITREKRRVSFRKGWFCGDSMGVGKGRIICASILDYFARGGRKAIWISKNPKLIRDAIRDWTDLGGSRDDILNLSKIDPATPIPKSGDRQILFLTYSLLRSGAKPRVADPMDKKVKASDIPSSADFEYMPWVCRAFAKLANKPDCYLYRAYDTYALRGGPHAGMSLESACMAVNPYFNPEAPDKRTIRAALGLKVDAEKQEPAGEKSRLRQVVEWAGRSFDGILAFDESHQMKSGLAVKGARGTKDVSQQAQCGIDLQIALPDARVIYSSATGATEVLNLAYAERLGLWGPGTSFATKTNFVQQIESGGVAAMELVARDMKQLGLYLARGLSFQGVEYDRITHVLSLDQRETYNKLADAWMLTLDNFDAALEVICGGKPSGKLKSAAMSALWGANQRFWNSIVTAMSLPSVLTDIENELAAGNSCVLQLVNTNEAAMERALGKLDEDDDLSDLDMSPNDQLIQLVEHCFPTQAQETVVDEATGKVSHRPVMDSTGNPVRDAEAMAMKEQLLAELSTVPRLDGPLEQLVNHFGPRNIAEVTGRSRRVVRIRENGTEKTIIENRSAVKCMAEAAEFQDGKRRILIFSDAGGTGQSYHADKKAKNQQRRTHYLLQAGWVADAAVQGFGRSHRSNQACAPLFKLVSTDIPGHARFLSTIARRLDQLGALTRGERQAASTGILKSSDNLESPLARQALYQLYRDLDAGKVKGISIEEFERQTGLTLRNEDGSLKMDLPPITRWLNRLLSMRLEMQAVMFECYHERLMAAIRKAEMDGTLDLGCEVIRADKIEKVAEHLVHTDKVSGAETKLIEFKIGDKTKVRTFDAMMAGREATSYAKIEFFARNVKSGKVYGYALANDRTDRHGSIVPHYIEFGSAWSHRKGVPQRDIRESDYDPRTYQSVPRWHRYDMDGEADMAEVRRLWDQQVATLPTWDEYSLSMITGAILPVWERLPQSNTKVRRLETTVGQPERFLGRVIDDEDLEDTLKRLGVEHRKSAESPETMAAKLLAGNHVYELVNGWKIKGSRVAGEMRIEITGPSYSQVEMLRQMYGAFWERIDWVGRTFLPAGDRAAESIRKLVQDKPVSQSFRLEKAA